MRPIVHKMQWRTEDKEGAICGVEIQPLPTVETVSNTWKKVTCPDCIRVGKVLHLLPRDWEPPLTRPT